MLSWWPPPDRVFPRKKPVMRLLPWCLVGRMLGYGVIDWREAGDGMGEGALHLHLNTFTLVPTFSSDQLKPPLCTTCNST